MTAVAASGTVDCSAAVASILQRFRRVGEQTAEDVKGDPAAVRAASQRQAQQAQQLSQLSRQARQRSTTLASSWSGGAYDAYAAKMGRTSDQLDETAQKLSAQAQKLEMAAGALEKATQAITAALADFNGKAARLVALSHTAAPGAVNAFIQAANTLGKSLADAAIQIREGLSQALDVVAGNDPTKPEAKGDLTAELWKAKGKKWGIDKFLSTDDLDTLTKGLEKAMGIKPREESGLEKATSKVKAELWKWDNDGKPLWQWGAGADDKVRTDLPGGGAAGAGYSAFAGPQLSADAKLGIEDNQLKAEAGGKFTVLDAKGNAYATYGAATVQANGEAYVGAQADASLQAGLHGASAHAGAFAGGKAEGSLAGDVGGIGAGVNGSVRYGIGAEFDAKATWDKGHITIGVQAGATLGFGASAGANIDIDVNKVWDTFNKYDPADAQALRDGATWVGNTATQAGHAIGNAIDWLEGK